MAGLGLMIFVICLLCTNIGNSIRNGNARDEARKKGNETYFVNGHTYYTSSGKPYDYAGWGVNVEHKLRMEEFERFKDHYGTYENYLKKKYGSYWTTILADERKYL